jgi:hypothetical protein
MQASFWGVGIDLDDGEMLAPAPFVRRRHTAAQWWFAETIYGQTVGAGPGSAVA